MANPEHLDILKQGVEVWNRWRKENDEIDPDLSYANLQGAELQSAELAYADLSDADLSNANLREVEVVDTDFSSANLQAADLSGGHLLGADFTLANLDGANLSEAFLHKVNFSDTNTNNIILSSAGLYRTIFGNNDLSNAIGLETVIHDYPSIIGIDTLQRSKGKIPEDFLRGCGLSDLEIEFAKLYNPDLSNEEIGTINYRIHELSVKRAFQINPLFISYSHSNTDFVNAIEQLLINEGIRFWRDIHDARAGRLEKQIDAAIQLNDVVLLVLSEHSTNSDWVEHEARKAREKEKKTGKDALCPIALDDSWKTCRWPERLREQMMEYNILDFSNWHDAPTFEKQFCKLVEGLNLFYK